MRQSTDFIRPRSRKLLHGVGALALGLALAVGTRAEPAATAGASASALQARAQELFQHAKYADAKAAFLKADKAGPSVDKNLGSAAAAAWWAGNQSEAKALFTKAIAAAETEKAYPNVLFFYGRLQELVCELPPAAKKKLEQASQLPADAAARATANEVQQGLAQAQQLRMQGQTEDAQALAAQLVGRAAQAFGAKNGFTLGTRMAWADALLASGKTDEALAEFQALTADYTTAVGADHPSTLVALNGVAACLAKRGDAAQAEKIFRDVLLRTERGRGENHILVAIALNNLGDFFLERKELDQAQPLLERAASIDGGLGPRSPQHLSTLYNLATLYRLRNEKDKSQKLFEQALSGFAATRGPMDGQTSQLANLMVQLQTADAGGGDDAKNKAELSVNRLLVGRPEISLEEMDAARKLEFSEQEFQQGHVAEAIRLAELALPLREKHPGRQNLGLALTLNDLGAYYEASGKFAQSAAYHRRSLEIREKSLGKDHAQVGTSLFNLASVLNSKGEQAAALPLIERAISVFSKSIGPTHQRTLEAEMRRAEILIRLGRYEGVRERLAAVVKNADETGAALPAAQALMWLSRVQDLQGQLSEGLDSAERALRAAKAIPNLSPGALPTFQQAVASLLSQLGRASEARALDDEALQQAESTQVSGAQRVVFYFHAAQDAASRGDDKNAEQLLEKTLELASKFLDSNHPDRLAAHSTLGQLYSRQGRPQLANQHLRIAVEGARALWGEDNENTAFGEQELGLNLAVNYRDGWEELFTQAVRTLEKKLGPAPGLGVAFTDFAFAAHTRGKPELALSAADRAVAILQKYPTHPALIPALSYRASILRSAGRLDEARKSVQQALEKLKAFGDNSSVSAAEDVLASIELKQGHAAEAIATERKSLRTMDRVLSQMMLGGSESKRVDLAYDVTTIAAACISLHEELARAGAKEQTEAAELALEGLLAGKGRALDAQAGTLEAARSAATPNTKRLLTELGRLRGRQLELFNHEPGPNEAPRADQAKELSQSIEATEKELATQTENPVSFEPTTLARVRARLSKDAILVEMSRAYETHEGRALPKFHYVAYTLDAAGRVGYADFGDAEALNQRVDAFRDALKRQADATSASRALFDATLGKLGPDIAGKQLILSPSGQLSIVPFEALVEPSGRFVIETHAVAYVSTGRDLLRDPKRGLAAPGPPVVVANPAFDSGDAGAIASTRGAAPGLSILQKAHWNALPGTAREARDVAAQLSGAVVLTGAEASEGNFKAVARPRILHVATHGFFLEGAPASGGATRGLTLKTSDAPPPPDAPQPDAMLRSGLVFAGANRHGEADHDGYVTAAELALMDLSGTQLVVLSACETGLGAASTGEGVFGLRRALALAGADSQVMSLWEVSDDATAQLMTGLYGGLQAGLSVGGALRQAQLKLMKEPRWHHPYFWAAFIASGRSEQSIVLPRAETPQALKVPPVSAGCAHCTLGREPALPSESLASALFCALALVQRRRGRSSVAVQRALRRASSSRA